MSEYVQVGVTALRGPDGKWLESVPMFVREEDAGKIQAERLEEDIGALLAGKMKEYMDGCRRAEATCCQRGKESGVSLKDETMCGA